MGDEDENVIDQLQEELKNQESKNNDLNSVISQSNFNNSTDENLIFFQLRSDDILEKIEHFFKGDIIKEDADGSVYYAKQTNEDLIILNEYGVNSMMQILGNYVNRNTSLSFYDEERINEILADVGDEISDFLLHNYEKMGLTTEFKKSRYKLLVLNTIHIIESTYRRAISGRESTQINSTQIYSQVDNIGSMNRMNIQPKKKFNLLNRKTW